MRPTVLCCCAGLAAGLLLLPIGCVSDPQPAPRIDARGSNPPPPPRIPERVEMIGGRPGTRMLSGGVSAEDAEKLGLPTGDETERGEDEERDEAAPAD